MVFDRHKLREVRNKKQIRQQALAHTTGLEQSYLCKLEKGAKWHKNPHLENITKIANGLECEISDLLSETVPTNKQEKYYARNRRKKNELIQ